MAFVRVKRTPAGSAKHYLVSSERVAGKVRQRTLAYLGDYRTVEEALEHLPVDIMLCRWGLRRYRDGEPCMVRRYFRGQPGWAPPRDEFYRRIERVRSGFNWWREPQFKNEIRRLEALKARLAELQEAGVVPKLVSISEQIWARHQQRMRAA